MHRYTSGVIAFHQDDEPTDAEVSQLLDDFEAAAFAGLDGDQYTWAAVEHVHEGVRHIHIVAPRIELTSGKAMNIAPPGWQSLFDPLRDKWNAERGWRSPADPELARDLQPGQQIRAPEWGKGDDPGRSSLPGCPIWQRLATSATAPTLWRVWPPWAR